MTSRTYDLVLTVNSVTGFSRGNNVIGVSSLTEGIIANVDVNNSQLKVKLNNSIQEFNNAEVITTSIITITGGSANTNIIPYEAPVFDNSTNTHTALITSITPNKYIAEKNATEQSPLVRLYSLFYPGEWYPPNANGNPTLSGEGMSWPLDFPVRFAEVRGDISAEIGYTTIMGGQEFIPYPIDSGGINISSEGEVNETTVTIANFDNLITTLVENPFIVGNNISNSNTAIVNGEYVTNIDPRTNPSHPNYDPSVVSAKGRNNAAWTYSDALSFNDEWQKLKSDSRDLLGAVVEIKSTFAKFLDVWPEYSTISSIVSNSIQVTSSLPYRVGDTVKSNNDAQTFTVIGLTGDYVIVNNNSVSSNVSIGDRLYIVNEDADEDSFTLDVFKIDSLSSLDDKVAVFSIVNWLQYFKLKLPKRKYTKNSCPFIYKGPECQYPSTGTGTIPGSTKTANGFFTINNVTTLNPALDLCSKNFAACELRNNSRHFGGFPGTGRTIPR